MFANTFYDLELGFVEHFQNTYCTFLTICPLVPPEAFQDGPSSITQVVEVGVNAESNKCFDCLDAQAAESVLHHRFTLPMKPSKPY